MKKNEHILVIRFSSLGDIAIIVPLFRVLFKTYPNLNITIVTNNKIAPIFYEFKRLNFFNVDFNNKHKGLIGLWRLFNELKVLNITCIADLHAVIRSYIIGGFFKCNFFKLKRKMKGGALEEGHPDYVPDKDVSVASEAPVADSTPVAVATQVGKSVKGGSSYQRYSDNIYISAIMGVGIMGAVWLMISRTLIRHKYSEVVSYSLMGAAVAFSLLLIIFKGVRGVKPQPGIVGAIKNILYVGKYLTVRSVPALLILTQIGVLCTIFYGNADYIFSSPNIPYMFGVFNAITLVMILAQCWVWKDKVKEIMLNVTAPQNPMILPGFILAAMLSGVAISQLYIILEYLRTDC